jgi:copper transporter 1
MLSIYVLTLLLSTYSVVASVSLEECAIDPFILGCEHVEYPLERVKEDLDDVCDSMPWMPGCSLSQSCGAAGRTDGYCHPISLLNDICLADRMGGMRGCRMFVKLCAEGSPIEFCKTHPSIPGVVTTREVRPLTKALCSSEETHTAQCGSCDLDKPRSCNYLKIYSDICKAHSGSSECSRWSEMCKSIPELTDVCGGDRKIGGFNLVTTDCINDSSNPACRDYVYPEADISKDLDSLCEDMPCMPACSLRSSCKSSGISTGYCAPMILLTDLCKGDAMSGMDGCGNYNELCKSTSQVLQCSKFPFQKSLPTTSSSSTEIKRMCADSKTDEALCPKNGLKCYESEYLILYAGLCKRSPNSPSCSSWESLCHDQEFLNLPFASEYCLSANEPDPGVVDCVLNSTNDQCKDFIYPESAISQDLDSLCEDMPCMPGCSLRIKCSENGISEGVCAPMQLLTDLCVGDRMMGMQGCKSYKTMCAAGSKVPQCSEFKFQASLPTTSGTSKAIKEICDSHFMEECPTGGVKCSSLDYLMQYSKLCKSMPEMASCGEWKAMCSDKSFTQTSFSKDYCELNIDDPPVMRMYFHFGLKDYILFKDWVPTNDLQYWFSFLAIIAMAIVYQLLVTIRMRLEYEWSVAVAGNIEDNSSSEASQETRFLTIPGFKRRVFLFETGSNSYRKYKFFWSIEVTRSIFQFVETTLSYSLMLIAMTFNVWLFLAVPLGFALGSLLFGRFRDSPTKPTCC